jgi:hypothetical protein
MRQQKKKKPPFATFAKAKRRRCQERRKTADLQVYQRFDSFTCSTHALFFSFIMFFFCVCVSKGRLGNVFEGLKKLAETCFRKVHSEYTKKKKQETRSTVHPSSSYVSSCHDAQKQSASFSSSNGSSNMLSGTNRASTLYIRRVGTKLQASLTSSCQRMPNIGVHRGGSMHQTR